MSCAPFDNNEIATSAMLDELFSKNHKLGYSLWICVSRDGQPLWLAPATAQGARNLYNIVRPMRLKVRLALRSILFFSILFPRIATIIFGRRWCNAPLLTDFLNQGCLRSVSGMICGPVGPRRRLTMFCRDGQDRSIIIKVGVNVGGSAACELESSALKELSLVDGWRHRIPRLLSSGDWRGRKWIAQSEIKGCQLGVDNINDLEGLWEEMPRTGSVKLSEWLMLRAVPNGHCLQQLRERLLDSPLSSQELRCGWIHGDYAPWNAIRATDREIHLIDLEYATKDQPVLIDLWYLRFSAAHLLGRDLPIGKERIIGLALVVFWIFDHAAEPVWRAALNMINEELTILDKG
ncbi:MAG: hypothetical protein EA401_00805 [Planctomycetota bacterium]|nr:MAG: hypothetical protein EA401_00805 [Planctomycetota bacterium]